MGDSSSIRSRKVQARAAAEQAMKGELPKIGEYSLQTLGPSNFSLTIGKVCIDNTSVEVGDALPMYVDFENELVVIDLESGGDSDGE